MNHAPKFAFYGQAISDTGRRSARPIHAQQLADAATRVQRHGGQIVADYFDVYPDRHRALHHRREARQLLLAIEDAERGFTAIIIAATATALTTISQYDDLIELCTRYGVQLWLPDIDEPVDRDNEEHQEVIKTRLWGVSPRLWNRILHSAAEEEAAARTAQPDRHSAISRPPLIPCSAPRLATTRTRPRARRQRRAPRNGRDPATSDRRARRPTASRRNVAPEPSTRHSHRRDRQPVTDQPPTRFAFYNRVCKEDEQDAETARTQLARCRAILESLGWTMVAVYVDSRESPYRRTTNQTESAGQEKPIP